MHRDIKPANLFLACRPDGGNIIKMLDFGISKTTESRPEQRVLTGQAVLGSPVYMSPEQLRNAKDIDARADIWSLGVVAYELLSGKPPFDGEGVGEIFAAILEKDPEPLHVKNWRLPPEVSAIIAKAIQRKPEDRWSDAAEMAKALKPFGSGVYTPLIERAEQVSRAPRCSSASRRRTRRVASSMRSTRLPSERARRAAGTSAAPPRPSRSPRRRRPWRPPPARMRSPLARWVGAAAAAVVIVCAVAAVASVRSRAVPVIAPMPSTAAATAPAPEASGDVADPLRRAPTARRW